MLKSRIVREGTISGLLGAAAVALWFFIVDIVTGNPLYTPATLGEALMSILGPIRGESAIQFTALYTIFHVIAFVILGIVVAAIMNASDREPSYLALLFLLFVVFEIAFTFYLYLLSMNGRFVEIAWYQIGIANLLASAAMGWYLFRKHPGSVHRMSEALAGKT